MFVVTETDAAAIRAAFDQRGEFAAAVELRRLFPGVTDMAEARECASTIAGWEPLPTKPRLVGCPTRDGSREPTISSPMAMTAPFTHRRRDGPLCDCETAGGPHPSVKRPRSVRGGTVQRPWEDHGSAWKDHESAVPRPSKSTCAIATGGKTIASKDASLGPVRPGPAISLGTAEAGTGGHAVRSLDDLFKIVRYAEPATIVGFSPSKPSFRIEFKGKWHLKPH